MSGLPKLVGLCPRCHEDFYMPDPEPGDECPNCVPYDFDPPVPAPKLVLYKRTTLKAARALGVEGDEQ